MNPHEPAKVSPLEMVLCLIKNKQIATQMIKREIQARYRGSVLGLVWCFFTPLLMLAVYTFFFSYVFQAKWGITQESNLANYAVILFVGLIIHGIFAECINRAPQLIISNVNFVKKIIFPLEILPWISLGSALFHAGISFIVLLMGQIILNGHIPWTAVFAPFIILPFLFFVLGCLWFFATMGVYLRDISQATGLITSVLLFVSPVFYSLSILPHSIKTIALFNPLTLIITELRKVLLFGELPSFSALVIYSICSVVIAWIGFYFFQKTRKGFADVL